MIQYRKCETCGAEVKAEELKREEQSRKALCEKCIKERQREIIL